MLGGWRGQIRDHGAWSSVLHTAGSDLRHNQAGRKASPADLLSGTSWPQGNSETVPTTAPQGPLLGKSHGQGPRGLLSPDQPA